MTAKVVSISTTDHKIGLSVKRKAKDDEDVTYKDYADGTAAAAQNGGAFVAAFGNLDKLLAEKKQSGDSDAGN